MQKRGIRFGLTLATALVLVAPLGAFAEEAFPLRAKYKSVKPISTDELIGLTDLYLASRSAPTNCPPAMTPPPSSMSGPGWNSMSSIYKKLSISR